MLAVTHDGRFHADDVCAAALVTLAYPDVKIIRTRDRAQIATADVVFDVGGAYDPDRRRFDHHQKGGAGSRPNGIPLASAGLTFRHLATAGLLRTFEPLPPSAAAHHVLAAVDASFIAPIDAVDCGFDLFRVAAKTREAEAYLESFEVRRKVADVGPLTISALVNAMNPRWNEPQDFDVRFAGAVETMTKFLLQAVGDALGKLEARENVLSAPTLHEGKLLALERFCPWQETLLAEPGMDAVLYVISPAGNGPQWNVECVPDRLGSVAKRKPLPEPWGGLEFAQLANVTGVSNAVFCHPGGFICGAGSREGALRLAELACQA